jgi:sugar/nucleoside kinase (ribokinase family)
MPRRNMPRARSRPQPAPRRGILVGGNFTVDRVKLIERYPEEDSLASILGESVNNGGLAFNVLTDLARLDAGVPLGAIGRVGDDPSGAWVLAECQRLGISTAGIRPTRGVSTSYTDVMSVRGTGHRTFFHHRGANARLDSADFDLSRTRAKLLHLGYLLLLDRLDRPSRTHGTRAGMVLARAQRVGLLTSIDVVSEDTDRYRSIVLPALRWVDYLFANEFETEKLTGLRVRGPRGRLLPGRIRAAATRLLRGGVRQVVLHFGEGAGAFAADGSFAWQGSVRLPRSEIAGSTGAGDAFAAGFLLGVHEELPIPEALRYGVSVAAASLRAPGASRGIGRLARCLALGARYGYRRALGRD